MVQFENISKHYGSVKALDAVSFEIRQGEILGLLGPNGAGKTTAMRILTGFFPPTRGRVWIKGRELFKDPTRMKRSIGYLPEAVSLYQDMQVQEFLSFVAALRHVPKKLRKKEIDDKLSRCGLWEVKNRLIKKLSKGFRQRVGIAQALIGDPDVLVLDEPTSSLDPKQIIEIRTLIRELGRERTLILSTHILPEVSMVCDRVIVINKGKVIASGTADELEVKVQDRFEINVVMGDRDKKPEALRLLETVAEIENVTVLEEHQDQVSLALKVVKGRDVRSQISRLFVENQIPLLEMRSSRLSLEEIFLKLVTNENQKAAVV